MNHSMGNMINKKTLVIAAALLAGALIAVYGFNVAWGRLVPFAFLAFFVWMHIGGHGMHGGHGGSGDNASRDEHAGHTPAPAGGSNTQALAPDADVRPLASNESATAEARDDSRRHGGC